MPIFMYQMADINIAILFYTFKCAVPEVSAGKIP